MNMQVKIEGRRAYFMRNFISVKPILHMVVTIAQHACDHVPKRILKAVNISTANISCEI